MKKALSVILALALVLCVFAACGKAESDNNETVPSGNTAVDVSSFKTIGDILNADGAESDQTASYDGYYIYVFKLGGSYYRAVCTDVDETVTNAIFELDVTAEDYDEQFRKLASSIAIDKIEKLDDEIIPQEELDKLVGKTGEDLLNDGWTIGSSYNLEDMEFAMNKGAFEYSVIFDGKVDNYDDFEENDIKPFTVKSVKLSGIGDAANIEPAPLFTKGVWSASIDGKINTYFVFDSETSGRTVSADGKGSTAFTCEQNGMEAVFHFGSDDDITNAVFSTADNTGTFDYDGKTVVYTFEYMSDEDADTFEVPVAE